MTESKPREFSRIDFWPKFPSHRYELHQGWPRGKMQFWGSFFVSTPFPSADEYGWEREEKRKMDGKRNRPTERATQRPPPLLLSSRDFSTTSRRKERRKRPPPGGRERAGRVAAGEGEEEGLFCGEWASENEWNGRRKWEGKGREGRGKGRVAPRGEKETNVALRCVRADKNWSEIVRNGRRVVQGNRV